MEYFALLSRVGSDSCVGGLADLVFKIAPR